MFALGWHVAIVGRCRVFFFFFFPRNGGGPLNDILVFGGTVLEVFAPVSPCHSLVQNFMDSVCNIF